MQMQQKVIKCPVSHAINGMTNSSEVDMAKLTSAACALY